MSIDSLYQEMILEHNRSPKNFNKLDNYTHKARGKNPLCGDDYEIFLLVEDNIIKEVGFTGVGCAISKSSASLLTTAIKDKKVDDVLALKDSFIELLTEEESIGSSDHLGKLKIFESVKAYPIRVKCATLIWRALESALNRG